MFFAYFSKNLYLSKKGDLNSERMEIFSILRISKMNSVSKNKLKATGLKSCCCYHSKKWVCTIVPQEAGVTSVGEAKGR